VWHPRAGVEHLARTSHLFYSRRPQHQLTVRISAKAADELTIRPLMPNRHQESLTVYTDGFQAYESLDEADAFTREYAVHGDGEYVDGDVHGTHVRATNRWCDRGFRRTEGSRRTNSHVPQMVSAQA